MNNQGRKFLELAGGPSLLVAPGVYDAMSAVVAEKAGFGAIYLGSMAASATLLGKPDIGLVSREEYGVLLSRICDVAGIPVVADAEGGYGDALAVQRTVRDYEAAGAAAMHLEDHEFGKHISMDKGRCIDKSAMVGKIKAAVDTRRNAETVIIARTDSYWAYGDLDHAIERVAAYAEAGADMVFIAALKEHEIARVAAAVPVPIVNTSSQADTLGQVELKQNGLNVLLHYFEPMYAAYESVSNWLNGLAKSGNHVGLFETTPDYDSIDHALGIDRYRKLHETYTQ